MPNKRLSLEEKKLGFEFSSVLVYFVTELMHFLKIKSNVTHV